MVRPVTLPFDYRTPILSGVQVFGFEMVPVFLKLSPKSSHRVSQP